MRPIHLVELDKTRPAVILTRSIAAQSMRRMTIAPITSTVRGLHTDVPVGPLNGLDHDSVISLDNITTVERSSIGRLLGYLRPEQEASLAQTIIYAFDLEANQRPVPVPDQSAQTNKAT